MNGQNVFSAFYGHLKEIREYRKWHPIARVVEFEDSEELLKKERQQEIRGSNNSEEP